MIEPTFNLDSFNGNSVYTKMEIKFRHIFNLIQMKKGTDPYNPDKGVEIRQYYYAYDDEDTIGRLENEIDNQVRTYTPYIPSAVKCFSRTDKRGNRILCIMLSLVNDEIKFAMVTDGENSSFELLKNQI